MSHLEETSLLNQDTTHLNLGETLDNQFIKASTLGIGTTNKIKASYIWEIVCLRTYMEPDEWVKDSGCSKHMTGNKSLFSTYKEYAEEHVDNLAFNLLSVGQICDNKCQVLFKEEGSEIIKDDKTIGNGIRKNGLYGTFKIVKLSLNVTFDESPPPPKLSPLVDDDVGEEEAIRKNTKIVNTNNEEDESIEVDEIINIKESKNHPLDQVIGNLNQINLRSQAQNHSNLFCFISTIEPKNVNEALKDKSWVVAMQEELNQFVANDVWELVSLPVSQSVIGTK
ncbi:hypothetical protein Tco_1300764 [Tanacetum coccineum]